MLTALRGLLAAAILGLADLLERQWYRLAYWKVADDELRDLFEGQLALHRTWVAGGRS